MKIRIKKSITLILCLVIAFSMVACTSSKDRKEESKAGRFIEKKIKIPEDRSINCMKVLEGGKIALIASDSQNNQHILISKDDGKTWTENKINISLEGKYKYFMDTNIFKNGDVLISYGISDHEPKEEERETQKNIEYKYVMVDSQGKKKDTNLDFIDKYTRKSDKKASIRNFKYSEKGDLFFSIGNEVIQIDGATKKEKRKFVNDAWVNEYALIDNSIIIWSYDNIIKYNTKTGKKEDLSKLEDNLKEFKKDNKPIMIGNSKNKLYYLNPIGLYSYDISSGESTKLMDSKSSRFIGGRQKRTGFSEFKNGQILVALAGESGELYNYTYSKNAKAVPDKKIRVYSLNSNFSMKNVIAGYVSANTDVDIEYESGNVGGNGATRSDVIKKLNTEILAGKGPDVILLDGLPVDYYIKQGVLEDMSDIISKYTSEGKLFKGLKNASTVDGKIYSYPTSMKIPVIFGEKEVINKISDLKSFTDTIKELGSKSDNRIFDKYFEAINIIPNMYYSYGYDWLNEDKSINKDKLKDFMIKAKEIYKINNEKYKNYNIKNKFSAPITKKELAKDMKIDYNELSEINKALSEEIHPELDTEKDSPQLSMGTISQKSNLGGIITGKTNNKKLDYKILSRNNQNMIIPVDTVGINSKSDNKEYAKNFVKYLLSEERQKKIGSLLPVNKKAFDYSMKNFMPGLNFTPYLDKENNRTVTGEGTKKNGTKVKNYSPNEDDINKIKKEIDKVRILPVANITLLNSVVKEFKPYIEGKIDVDKAVKNVVDDLELYLKEQ